MNSLNTFLNEFSAGFQYNNRFACQVLPPAALTSKLSGPEITALGWLKKGILVESTNLPDRAFVETQITQYGLTEQFPYHTEYTTLDCSFLTPIIEVSDAESSNPLPKVFAAWQNLIQDMSRGWTDSTRNFTFMGSCYGTLKMAAFDRKNTVTIAYEFEKAYPRLVQSTPVNWKEEGEFARLTIGFTFSNWKLMNSKDFAFAEPFIRGGGAAVPFGNTLLA